MDYLAISTTDVVPSYEQNFVMNNIEAVSREITVTATDNYQTIYPNEGELFNKVNVNPTTTSSADIDRILELLEEV